MPSDRDQPDSLDADNLPFDADNLPFVEAQYRRYLADSESVEPEWRTYFEAMDAGEATALEPPRFESPSIFAPPDRPAQDEPTQRSPQEQRLALAIKQDRVSELATAYRRHGHLYADLDPLDLRPKPPPLRIEDFGLRNEDLDIAFSAGRLRGTLREIIAHLEETYCRSIGVELGHIDTSRHIRFELRDRIERTRNRLRLSREQQLKILTKLTDAEIFEHFLHTKFVGAKRFSLEGAESLIPLVELIIESCARQGVDELIIGMAHRGRLNVLANILGKPAREIFDEFADRDPTRNIGRGDVKYHLGYACDREVDGLPIHVSLSFNPSHLEFVNPVVLGRVRAKQDRRDDDERRRVVPLLIHGDASFAGEGIVAEMFNMSELPGYRVGGTIHIVVNNQVGFTTSPEEGRSTLYPTDSAKMLQMPILHVNGEDPAAVAQVARLAVDLRTAFAKDVVIDLWCYRKYGHNEGDDPHFTQPLMYRAIEQTPSVREQYVSRLIEMGQISQDEADEIAGARRKILEDQLAEMQESEHVVPVTTASRTGELWEGYQGGPDARVPRVDTGVSRARLQRLSERLTRVPESFAVNRKIARLLDQRREMGEGERLLDWGMAEALAFASLLDEGVTIRFSGQDSVRGTFSHRHAALVDQETGEHYMPLQHVGSVDGLQGRCEIYNSPLSEAGVLGFEFGYSRDMPDGLTVWEAQFGDFANAAQVIIDQFIVSYEDKWKRLSGITLLLPHGHEGQGPEHTSARLDRWLSLCAEDNIQVCNLTTPAQYFHTLRRQVVRPYRKPLIIMSPKSLLRHPEAISPLDELARGRFQRVLPDPAFRDGERSALDARRALLCSGKVYYELVARRDERGASDAEIANTPIIRVEQLYPSPIEEIREALTPFRYLRELVWVQEEPRNGGAWLHMWSEMTHRVEIDLPLLAVTRTASASPATGSAASHRLEQSLLLDAAFDDLSSPHA